jgi:hypothetical protein
MGDLTKDDQTEVGILNLIDLQSVFGGAAPPTLTVEPPQPTRTDLLLSLQSELNPYATIMTVATNLQKSPY